MNELYVRALVAVVLASICFGAGWKVATWRSDAATAAAARQYATDLAAAEAKLHAQEQAALSRQAGIEASYLSQLGKVKHEKDLAIDSANKLGLYITADASSCNPVSNPSTTTGLSNGRTLVRIPPATSSDLIALASDADAIVEQLRACQQVILNDRKVLPEVAQ